MRIGLLSDTHGFLDPAIAEHFKNVDEIWHAGDIGDPSVSDELKKLKPLRAVYGNIDGPPLNHIFPEDVRITVEGFDVWMTHIGGSPPNYNPQVKKTLNNRTPDIFICGHSHILRIKKDAQRNNMLYLNPGAAGNHGFHLMKTVVRFELAHKEIKKMEVIELGKRGAINR